MQFIKKGGSGGGGTGATVFTDLTDVPSAYTGQGGKVVAVKADVSGLEFVTATGTDEKVKYDILDPTAGYIADKVVAGTGISVAEGTGATENKLVVTNSAPDQTVAITDSGVAAVTGTYPNFNIDVPDQTYTLPTAAAATLGGVKVGTRLSIDGNGVLSADVQSGGGDMAKSTYDPANISEQLVGLTATQSLTNKTLNSNTNYIDADATHQKVFLNLGRAGAIGDAVFVSGWNISNNCAEVGLARANSTTTLPCAGVLESAGADGTVQSMRVEGLLTGVNTNARSAGTRLYVSAATAGALTSTRPTTPNLVQAIATVIFQSATVGVLDVIRTAYVGTMAYADTATYYLASNPSGYTSNTGTVTSVAALTIGTTGTDISSTVATGTTTPVITIQIPTASASNRGALSSTDWSTFNNKQAALTNPVTGTGTINEISYWTGAGTQGTLPVATYPSLTELSYVKGVTSAIQTQINAKGAGTVTAVSVATANGISGSSSGGATPALTLTLGAITPSTVNALTLASQANGFTIAGGTTSKTLTVPLDASVSGTNTGDNATNSSSMPAQPTTIELGHASDTTLARVSAGVISVEGVTIPSISSTNTLTNKRRTPRVLSAASYTTDTGTSLNCDNLDRFIVTAQAGALKFNNPTGTPTDGQPLFISVTGTSARALTYDTQFEASTVALPTTTVTTARLNMLFIWAAERTKWVLLAAV